MKKSFFIAIFVAILALFGTVLYLAYDAYSVPTPAGTESEITTVVDSSGTTSRDATQK